MALVLLFGVVGSLMLLMRQRHRPLGDFMKNFTLLCGLIFLLLAECSQGTAEQQTSAQQNNQNTVYENQYLKVVLLPGWTAKKARRTPAAVNISKGNYILYLNTQASQASGVEGGRFAEIAMGAPSADAVVTEYPSPPCGKAESRPALDPHTRVDLYVSKAESKSHTWCNAPSSGATVWYFSYITDAAGGYFNFYVPGQNRALVVTTAYRSKNVNSLPFKGSTELDSMLSEMTSIMNSLKIKRK
ncbi:MAG TPA: hypothetical protein VHA33_29475 [Candidatus Angelobacter sp.]|nr:hypothetical protein [Candidatus Angelobacter sp.]